MDKILTAVKGLYEAPDGTRGCPEGEPQQRPDTGVVFV